MEEMIPRPSLPVIALFFYCSSPSSIIRITSITSDRIQVAETYKESAEVMRISSPPIIIIVASITTIQFARGSGSIRVCPSASLTPHFAVFVCPISQINCAPLMTRPLSERSL